MKSITENEIKKVLQSYEKFKEHITKRIMSLYKEMEDTDSQIATVAYKKPSLDGYGGFQSEKKDLFDILEKHEKNVRMQAIEIRTEIQRLVEEEENYNRVWAGYRSLRGDEYSIITALYIRLEPYKAVEAEYEGSHRKFEFVRKSALNHIKMLYESEFTNLQIVQHKYCRPKNKSGRQDETKDDKSYVQLKLSI
ncbi:hypothetical protein M2454_000756 [Aequitasia blattaphilus]|uniref:Uncharacterized protein n=1 Tax=Aequitasia blattaphilus TaxID=2949332 RepID=A0ABT1E814_9FIRM|nr:hypothetical protein [Aequitasia blattaphilus]MCP1101963.1 hypothetical protein [Aequitasia blattaphilus]MCR8614603.1 hypothetical protein [Aequitasia blattaphilus]